MLTRAPRTTEGQSAQPRTRRIWPWAAGSILFPLLVITSTLLGARAVGRARLAAEVTSAQTLPLLDVTTVIQPFSGVAVWTLATGAQGKPVIVALEGQAPSTCLPSAPCAGPSPATVLAVYDAATGAQLSSHPISPANVSACSSPDSSRAGTVYIVCANHLEVFDLATGGMTTPLVLPSGVDGASAALDAPHGALYMTGGSAASNQELVSYDLASGNFVAMQALTAGGTVSSPITDAADGRVLLVEDNGGQPMLAAFAARTLEPLGAVALPAGTTAGPFDAASDQFFFTWPSGAVGAVNLRLTSFSIAQTAPAAQVTQVSPQSGSVAFGFDTRTHALIGLSALAITEFDIGTLTPVASTPVSGDWNPQRPLPVDSADGMVYAPDRSGAIVGLRLAPSSGPTARDPATAIALTRSSLDRLLPDTNQTPPFLTRWTFPLTQTTTPRTFAIYVAGTGWRGPYTGSAIARVVAAGPQPGDYTVAFTVTWNQLFPHTHTWTVELTPDGRVKMVSDTGDVVP